MADDHDPTPSEDPREKATSDQNAEESHGGARPDGGESDAGDSTPDAPETSHDDEGDAGQATGNPDAAG